jgi:hypothetical protein
MQRPVTPVVKKKSFFQKNWPFFAGVMSVLLIVASLAWMPAKAPESLVKTEIVPTSVTSATFAKEVNKIQSQMLMDDARDVHFCNKHTLCYQFFDESTICFDKSDRTVLVEAFDSRVISQVVDQLEERKIEYSYKKGKKGAMYLEWRNIVFLPVVY